MIYSRYKCGYCLFIEEIGSCDVGRCSYKSTEEIEVLAGITDPPCARWRDKNELTSEPERR